MTRERVIASLADVVGAPFDDRHDGFGIEVRPDTFSV
jgi:hypothetical protein